MYYTCTYLPLLSSRHYFPFSPLCPALVRNTEGYYCAQGSNREGPQ